MKSIVQTTPTTNSAAPLLCFSHLGWDFVTQRPQHLMRRFARDRRVFYWEEPIGTDHPTAYLEHHPITAEGVIVLRPRLPRDWGKERHEPALRGLLDQFVATCLTRAPILWFYTPMMLGFAEHLDAAAIVYDCMDELSAFRFADPVLATREAALLERADVVFTGGRSLYEAKRGKNRNVHAFPSSVDTAHFAAARRGPPEPDDQRGIPGPRLGWYGVIDERFDAGLIAAVADARPDWSLVMIGPVVKIDPATLPERPNIHWLGGRDYARLPAYLAGWDAALMPFAINEATRFISPTKTPEYLAGGVPVVSTPVVDVVAEYARLEGVGIADTPAGFVAACEAALALPGTGAWRDEADALLATMSWDRTFAAMDALIDAAMDRRRASNPANDIDKAFLVQQPAVVTAS